jgi:serine/threonine protein kinase
MAPPDICILTEYMARGSLYRILHDGNVELYWEIRRKFAIDAARGMNYLHSSDPIIIHRDLKSHNLLVSWLLVLLDSNSIH